MGFGKLRINTTKNSSDFKTIEKWEAYKMGADDAIKARQTDIFRRLSYGIEETNSMFEDDWAKET